MNLLDAVFRQLRATGRRAFIPFIVAGDPDLHATPLVLDELVAAGADVIEIGFPYSDPIADGPVIQASYSRALAGGLCVEAIFDTVGHWQARRPRPFPLVAMASFSLLHRRGPERFLEEAAAAGFHGAVVPDLPLEESAAVARRAAEQDFKLIQLVAPTTPRERAAHIARASTGFLYCVSVAGVTGARTGLPAALRDQLAWLRNQTDLTLCVGFGVSTAEQAKALREAADGIIVGSALVRKLEEAGQKGLSAAIEAIGAMARDLRAALDSA